MSFQTIYLIEKQAKLSPHKRALSYKGNRLTYSELNGRANQLAAFLIDNGAVKEGVIAVAVDRSAEMVILLIAILKSGAAYVPLDPDYPEKRLEYMLNDSAARFSITNKKYEGRIQSQATELILEDLWQQSEQYPTDDPGVAISETDLAYILYTSGSTGMPKGVMIEHRNLFNLLTSMQKFPGIDSDDTLLALTTISFDISVLELFLPFTVGAHLVITDTEVTKDGAAILEEIKRNHISIIQATPSTYKMMLAAEWNEKFDLKVLCCGEQLPKDLAEKLLSRCKGLYNMYGPTETTIYSSGKQILATDEVITIGYPIQNTSVYILDEQNHILSEGETGEISIGGEGLARGYFNKPELSAEKFITHVLPDDPLYRIYKTGDLGRILPNGEIQCFGRIDHQVKIRGYRIELGEIEYALIQQSGVKETVVAPWDGPNGDKRLAAYIVPENRLSNEDFLKQIPIWKEALKASVPTYMVPGDFVLLEKMPLTNNGKVDRKALPVPEIRASLAIEGDQPQTEIQQILAEIWKQHLGVHAIGIHDNFFDLGGHSLTAVKVMVRIKNKIGKQLPLGTLFKNPTIVELAECLEAELPHASPESLIPLQPLGKKMPLYIIHGIGSTVFKFFDFAQQLGEDQPVFGLQARGIDGTENPAETIEEMATQYITEILKSNPDGPYALSGYSLGGLIAFEMTRQLEAMGKEVRVLAMFDTYIIKNNQLEPGLYKSIHRVTSRIAKFFYTFSLLLAEPRRTIEHKLFTIAQSFKKMKGEEVRGVLDEDFDFITKVGEVHRAAIPKYKLKPYHGDIHLFRARKVATYLNDFKFLGWKPYAKAVHIHQIDGEHDTIFNTPINRKFADSLQRLLDNAGG
ncbi:non-ribosomal peptide synthetase [Pedobacter frigoris]|uniref:Amino acid adenylation domain-containing protein n=1 Tax=Pedobacter frigoris TaxID=2571272 RepID=A0A4U1CTN4_9SPHI|nr:amino acid adenylation domain-containing protein [Pedobacter frigoris]TKC09329.1 amino acid adenylation domain-containing protein [Pedobacter frigoris]